MIRNPAHRIGIIKLLQGAHSLRIHEGKYENYFQQYQLKEEQAHFVETLCIEDEQHFLTYRQVHGKLTEKRTPSSHLQN